MERWGMLTSSSCRQGGILVQIALATACVLLLAGVLGADNGEVLPGSMGLSSFPVSTSVSWPVTNEHPVENPNKQVEGGNLSSVVAQQSGQKKLSFCARSAPHYIYVDLYGLHASGTITVVDTGHKGRASPYLPVIHTIDEVLRLAGLTVEIWARRTYHVLCRRIKEQARNCTPIVVAVGWHRSLRPIAASSTYGLSQLGAYLILYQTEPWLPILRNISHFAQRFRAKEVWEYSKAAAALAKTDSDSRAAAQGVAFRFVPPACAKALDLAVSRSPGPRRDESRIGFMGAWRIRSEETRAEFGMGGRLDTFGEGMMITHRKQWRKYLEHYPLQLSVHSTYNTAKLFETPRAAQLLTNGACLLSENSALEDEEEYKGAVHFGSGSELQHLFLTLQNNSANIRACQERAQREFCSRFSIAEVLHRSGFTEVVGTMPD